MLRLFIALVPPTPIKQQLLLLRRSIMGARWQNSDQMHITINFIGEVDNGSLPQIIEALSAVTFKPLELNINGVDFFGSSRQPRALYAKVTANPELLKLNKKLSNVLLEIDIKTDRKKFKPHITLARLKQASFQSVGQFIQAESLFKTEAFTLDKFHLLSSKLSSDGSQYVIEESFPFVF